MENTFTCNTSKTKVCKDCEETLSLDNFYKQKNCNLGVRNRCKDCFQQRRSNYRKKNKLNKSDYDRIRYQKNRNDIIEKVSNNYNSEIKKVYDKAYNKNNRYIRNAQKAKYRAKKLKATPTWLTSDQLQEIKYIYKSCPEGHHVDHIIPLQGKNICGLHVPWNLQHLTALENIKKSNKI